MCVSPKTCSNFVDKYENAGAAEPGGQGGLGPPTFQRINNKEYVLAHPVFTQTKVKTL